MKTFRLIPSLIAIALAAPLVATPGSVRDFQLQPAPTPTATPQVQGPVDVEGTPVAPRVIPRPAPSPAPSPSESVSPAPAQTSPVRTAPADTPRTATSPSRRAPAERPTPRVQPTASTGQQPALQPEPTPSADTSDTAQPSFTPGQLPSAALPDAAGLPAPDPDTASDESGGGWLGWIVLIFGLTLLGLGGLFFWRRRQTSADAVPQIERPTVKQTPEPSGSVSLASAAADVQPAAVAPAEFSSAKSKFQAKVEAQSLSRSVMNATLVYRLELQNLGSAKIEDISVYADVVSAHGKSPIGEQLADENSKLAFAAFVADVKSRDAHEVKGEFRLPLGQIKTIAQGSAKLFVPLLRIRIESEHVDTIIHTFVIGMKPEGGKGKLLPFRLDEMAQTYRNIGLRQIG